LLRFTWRRFAGADGADAVSLTTININGGGV